jgi:hypothetical protein
VNMVSLLSSDLLARNEETCLQIKVKAQTSYHRNIGTYWK